MKIYGNPVCTPYDPARIQEMKGEKGDPGPQGERGPEGYTPQKGVDYYTEAEREEMAKEVLNRLPVVSAVDLSNYEKGSFTETVNGEQVTHTVFFDASGRPTQIDGIVITWGAL